MRITARRQLKIPGRINDVASFRLITYVFIKVAIAVRIKDQLRIHLHKGINVIFQDGRVRHLCRLHRPEHRDREQHRYGSQSNTHDHQ